MVRRVLALVLLGVVVLVCAALAASESLRNDSRKTAFGVTIQFSDSVRITSWDTATFPTCSPSSGRAESFTFSGGELASGGRFRVSWTPSTAEISHVQWEPAPEGLAALILSPVVQNEIPLPTKMVAGIHAGGNWGYNVYWAASMPRDWLSYITQLNANWVGINISLGLDDSMDATVEIANGDTPGMIVNFDDGVLRNMIRTLRSWGFHVYAALAFENLSNNACCMDFPLGKYLGRWDLGDPNAKVDATFPEYWPWSPSHPDHAQFVAEFFRTYTDVAVHYGQLLQDEGAELYSLSGETDLLFRTRPSPPHLLTSYGPELKQMVEAVRTVYHGALTLDQYWEFAVGIDPYWPGGEGYASNSWAVWGDLGLDVIGISAKFTLEDRSLRDSWERVFTEYLEPLRAAYPSKPIVFTECGYVDLPDSVHQAWVGAYTPKQFMDADKDGLDDGEETQAGIIDALFETMAAHPGVLQGVFLWDMPVAPDSALPGSYFLTERCESIRRKLAESVVRDEYGAWLNLESSRPAQPR